MDISTPATPSTPADSLGGYAQRQQSTQPSSPVDVPEDQEVAKPQIENGGLKEGGEFGGVIEDLEGMDVKAKALMHLLKTSSV